MCDICDSWQVQKITSKKALELIGTRMYSAKKESTKSHLMSLVNKILDLEVPTEPVSKEAEKAFWEQTHSPDDEE